MSDAENLPEIWKKKIQAQTGKVIGVEISPNEIESLDFEMDLLESIDPVRLFTSLTFLNISTTGIADLSPLKLVPNLRT